MPTTSITITALVRTEASGDWHDRPLRYSVNGPGNEVQKFPTIAEAKKYRAVRRRSETQNEAIRNF